MAVIASEGNRYNYSSVISMPWAKVARLPPGWGDPSAHRLANRAEPADARRHGPALPKPENLQNRRKPENSRIAEISEIAETAKPESSP